MVQFVFKLQSNQKPDFRCISLKIILDYAQSFHYHLSITLISLTLFIHKNIENPITDNIIITKKEF